MHQNVQRFRPPALRRIGAVGIAAAMALGLAAAPAAADEIGPVAPGALKAAITAADDGATIFLEEGVYKEQLRIEKGITLVGVGEGKTIFKQEASGGKAKQIDIYNANGVTLKNFTVEGSGDSGVKATGIDANSVSALTLDGITVKGFAKNGISVSGQWSEGTATSSSDIRFNNVTSTDNAWAGIAFYTKSNKDHAAGISNVTFSGVTNVKNTAYGIQFGDVGTIETVTGANDGPVALGVVHFESNTTSNVVNNNDSDVTLDRASTINGNPIAKKDFSENTLKIVPALATTTVLNASPTGAVEPGTAVTLSAQVNPANAVGTVEIFNGDKSVGSGDVVDGAFTAAVSNLGEGDNALKAVFTPADEDDFVPSTSSTVTVTVKAKVTPPPVKQDPVTPPAANTDSLEELIESLGLDVDATTDSFVPVAGVDLSNVDATEPFSGSLPWGNDADAFVDVYVYSTPVLLGTFPVIDGAVQLTGVDLSALAAGDHHLVFIGQTSGEMQVMEVTLAAAPTPTPTPTPTETTPPVAEVTPTAPGGDLAKTGSDAFTVLAVVAALLLGGAGVLVARRKTAQN